ncbi:SpoIIE family protein phosphatase [Streptomyces sp. NPDC056341]|uniref:SpoIIE family protein phosphatase n=1 Tax=Streptomyces sp. NPDC056341 TaxID=3345788 RepID=UPI0035DA0CB2
MGVRSTAEAASCRLATCLYAVYDPVTRRCTLARAGHLPPATCHLPPATCHLPPLRLTALSPSPTCQPGHRQAWGSCRLSPPSWNCPMARSSLCLPTVSSGLATGTSTPG